MKRDWLYQQRDPAAAVGAVLIMGGLWLAGHHMPARKALPALSDDMVVRMEELNEPMPVAPSAPPAPMTPVQPTPKMAPTPTPVQKAPTPTPTPVATPTPTPTPSPSPAPAPAPSPAPAVAAAPAHPAPVAVPAPAPAQPRPVASSRNLEDKYSAQVIAYLHSIKRYPTSRDARQLRPAGTVTLWLEIDRAGQLMDTGVESSSGSMVLDQQALRTVRSGRYPVFPQEAYQGQNQHRFLVQLEYVPPEES